MTESLRQEAEHYVQYDDEPFARIVGDPPIDQSMDQAAENVANGPIHGFIRVIDIQTPAEEIDEINANALADLPSDILVTIERAMSSKDQVMQIGRDEFLIAFGTTDIAKAEDSLIRWVSEIRSMIYRRSPTLDVTFDHHAETTDAASLDDPAAIYSNLREFAPSLEEKARWRSAMSLARSRGMFQSYWSPHDLMTGANRVAIDMPAESRRRIKKAKNPDVVHEMIALHDREHLNRALWASMNTTTGRGKTEYVVPVHARTLVDNALAPLYFEGFSSLMQFASNRVIVEIQGIDMNDVEALAASAAVATLRNGRVRMTAAAGLRDLGALRHLYPMLHGISCRMPPTRIIDEIRMEAAQWSRFAELSGLDILMSGINSIAQARIAADAGIDHMCGNAIQFATDVPRAPQAYTGIGFKFSHAA